MKKTEYGRQDTVTKLTSKFQGPRSQYRKPRTRHLAAGFIAMSSLPVNEVDEIKTQLAPTLRELRVGKAILFGSVSRGTRSRKSDIDLLLVVETEERFFDRYRHFEVIYSMLKGRSVDMLIYTPSELERIAHRPFIRRILAEGKTIYEH